MPYSPMHKHCTPVKNLKGKTTGLMMEGSAMHMSMLHQESEKQEKENLEGPEGKNPIDDKASAVEMSPYKMGHEDSPAEMSPYKMGHEDSPAKMGHESPAKNLNKGYGYEVPKPSVAKMEHESPAKFTGMSGGSALHEKMPMVKVNGKMVPKFAADGKGKNDLKKK